MWAFPIYPVNLDGHYPQFQSFLQKKHGQNIYARSQKSNIINNKEQTKLVISETTRNIIESLEDNYTSEASSYKQMANAYADELGSTSDAAFGIIIGSIYSAFIHSYSNQQQKPSLEDIQEFTQIVKKRSAQIKRSILDAKT